METFKADVIHHTTRTRFSFVDRLKILIGGEVVTDSEIETGHEHCIVKKSSAKSYVNSSLFNWVAYNLSFTRTKRGMYVNSIDQVNNARTH